jgi:hypothetical protein
MAGEAALPLVLPHTTGHRSFFTVIFFVGNHVEQGHGWAFLWIVNEPKPEGSDNMNHEQYQMVSALCTAITLDSKTASFYLYRGA